MKTAPITLLTAVTAVAPLAGCTATSPEAGSSSPSIPTPAPTVTITVTATPEPAEPVSEEIAAAPVMASAKLSNSAWPIRAPQVRGRRPQEVRIQF